MDKDELEICVGVLEPVLEACRALGEHTKQDVALLFVLEDESGEEGVEDDFRRDWCGAYLELRVRLMKKKKEVGFKESEELPGR